MLSFVGKRSLAAIAGMSLALAASGWRPVASSRGVAGEIGPARGATRQ